MAGSINTATTKLAKNRAAPDAFFPTTGRASSQSPYRHVDRQILAKRVGRCRRPYSLRVDFRITVRRTKRAQDLEGPELRERRLQLAQERPGLQDHLSPPIPFCDGR